MKIKYNIERDGLRWIITRSLIAQNYIITDYYTGRCFNGRTRLIKRFWFKRNAKRALRKLNENL